MGGAKQINIKNRTYFYNDIIDLKDFGAKLLKIDKKSYKNIKFTTVGTSQLRKLMIMRVFIAWILYFCILIMQGDRYIEEKYGSRYLIFDSVDENKEVLKKYANVWNGIKNKTKEINGDKENDYGKD